ncbi:hypothetical protein DFH05DRAFT_947757 [Lentinula detonsa]|uniref:TFIIS-type domain-containing protein n=1 Tax=Lentinula detonsa TaxID=2804962 RepID=A0A9W8P3Z4_9AGAR|nr:hypothetical protein DFH05DRAFT_947757 [Lentinula detonsa]
MVFACRICQYEEASESKCSDPTLAHSNVECPRCGNEDAVLFQDQSKRKETRMILFFVCSKCNHSFTDPTVQSDTRENEEG